MINHSNIYAHRRFGSRLGKSKLSISSASSMISLATVALPPDEEFLAHSLKNETDSKEDEADFNFDETHDAPEEEITKHEHDNVTNGSQIDKIG